MMCILVHQGYVSRDVLHPGRHLLQHSGHVANGGYPLRAVLVLAGILVPPWGYYIPGYCPPQPLPPAIGFSPCPSSSPYTCTLPTDPTVPHRTTITPHLAGPSCQSRMSLTPHTRSRVLHLTESSKPGGSVLLPMPASRGMGAAGRPRPLHPPWVLAAAAPPGLRVLLPGSTAGSRRHGATSE
jgi:hypothetical protein